MHLNSVIALDFLTICGIHVLINRSKIWSIYRCKVTAVVHIQPAIKDDNILVETHERPSDYCQENSSLYDRIGQDTYRWLRSSTSSGVHSSLVYINYHLYI